MELYKKAKFDWDKDLMMAHCTINAKGDGEFIGVAFCHDDDADMCNQLTGETIAYFRACISYYKFLRNNRIKPGLKALKQLLYSSNRSKHYNPDSYESKMLRSQISVYEDELAGINEAIEILERDLNDYINVKDEKYKIIRQNRKAKELGLDKY